MKRFFILFCLAIGLATATSYAQQPSGASLPMGATASQTMYVFDLDSYLNTRPDDRVWQYDVVNLVTALQGLVNRQQPQLYILFVRERLSSHQLNVDQYWLDKIHSNQGPFSAYNLVEIEDLRSLIELFRPNFTGVVLWDPKVPATVNVAMTVAGVDGLLPVRHDTSPNSLFNQLVMSGPELPSIERLTDQFTGVGYVPLPPPFDDRNINASTPKNDSYTWARILYLETQKTSPKYFANYIDAYDWDTEAPGVQYPDLYNCQIVNRDFYVAERAFFADLDPHWDQVATDIKWNPFHSGYDNHTLRTILGFAYDNLLGDDQILRVGGFVPWWKKYSTYDGIGKKHSEEETAEEFVSIMSAYNGVIDADSYPFGALANASVYRHVKLPERFFQNKTPQPKTLENKNYLLFIVGDFRSSALLYQTIPYLWDDPYRGVLPIAWSVAPMLSERVPHVFQYMYDTRTPNDYFIGAGAAAGLCYPNRYIPPREHSDLDANGMWFLRNYTKELYKKFDLRHTAAADLDRDEGVKEIFFNDALQTFFREFSPHGVLTLKPYERRLSQFIVPFDLETANIQERLLPLDSVVERIVSSTRNGQPTFQAFRFNLASPTSLYYLYQQLITKHPDMSFEVVDPISYFYLLRQHYSGGDPEINFALPTFIDHTIPRTLSPGAPVQATFTLRNDGWDVWDPERVPANQRYRITYQFQQVNGAAVERGRQAAFIDHVVRTGEMITVDGLIEPPEDAYGVYDLVLRFEQENVRVSPIFERIRVVIQ